MLGIIACFAMPWLIRGICRPHRLLTIHKEALTELRELVRGIHPPALELGLGPALETLTARCSVPVELRVQLPDRPSPAVEALAYFSVAELLTDIVEHAHADRAWVSVLPDSVRTIAVTVRDNGIGGVREPGTPGCAGGSGLRGLAARAASVDDSLSVHSPIGGPTVDAILRDGLAGLLVERGHEIVAMVGDASRSNELGTQHNPDVAVVDVRLPPSFTDEGREVLESMAQGLTNQAIAATLTVSERAVENISAISSPNSTCRPRIPTIAACRRCSGSRADGPRYSRSPVGRAEFGPTGEDSADAQRSLSSRSIPSISIRSLRTVSVIVCSSCT